MKDSLCLGSRQRTLTKYAQQIWRERLAKEIERTVCVKEIEKTVHEVDEESIFIGMENAPFQWKML